MTKRYIVGMTGASGAIYGVKLIKVLLKKGFQVELIITDAGKSVWQHELEVELTGDLALQEEKAFKYLEEQASVNLKLWDCHDISQALASGSVKVDGMIIIPCSMGSTSNIAVGRSGNLLERAADVMLKEGRKLILVPRETPFNAIHLENLLKLAQMGVKIVPAMPGFYHKPKSVEDIVDFLVGKVLNLLDIEHDLLKPWREEG